MDSDTTNPWSSFISKYLILFVALVVTLTTLLLNARLIRENRRLHHALENEAMSQAPRAGSHITLLHGTDPSGKPTTIDFRSFRDGSLLIVMSPKCVYCQADMQTWKHLLELNKSLQVSFINLSDSDDTKFLSPLHLSPGYVRLKVDQQNAMMHNFVLTPTLVILDAKATVVWAWAGALGPDQVKALEQLPSFNNHA